ncbi:MAG TPA: carbohydrate ABC transporter permease [Kiritimatiellia bacterium]
MISEAHQDAGLRRLNSLVRALTIYGLLLGGAAIFSLPFLWMIGTSFKVDREMFGDRITIFPARPVPAQASPYLDARYFPDPRSPRWPGSKPVIEKVLREHKREPVLAPGIFQRLEQIVPASAWQNDLAVELPPRITVAMMDEVQQKISRRLCLGPVRVRSLDLQEKDVTMGQLHSDFWHVAGENASIANRREDGTAFGELHYDFSDGSSGEVRLNTRIRLPFPVERLHRIQLFVRPDDSWHIMEIYVEKLGSMYKAKRPEFMGNFQWTAITLQDYGEDDASTKIKLWNPLVHHVGRCGPLNESEIGVTLVLRENTGLGAWWAKCQRNYRGALDYIPFWRYTATSIFLVLLNIVCTLASCSLVAFSFARLQWPGRGVCFGVMLATMMIPAQVTMIPYFLIIKWLGWYNTLKPLWVVSLCGNAFNIFLLRQFMKGIPRDLEDAARIDGCNSFQVYLHVILPLVKPTLACIAIFTFMGVWNDFMGPLIYLSDQRLYPLSLGLYAFNVQSGGSFGMMMAGSLLMTMPVIAIFFFAQKYFIQGVTLTGMKG